MKNQFRFVIGKKDSPKIVIENQYRHINSIPKAKKELKEFVNKIYGEKGWGRLEKATWTKILEV